MKLRVLRAIIACWKAETRCAVCGFTLCEHTDDEYAGKIAPKYHDDPHAMVPAAGDGFSEQRRLA